MKQTWIQSQLDRLTKYLVSCSKQNYKPYQINMAIIFGSTLELVAIPIFFVVSTKWLDYTLTLGKLFPNDKGTAPAVLAFCLGLTWMLWSIFTQHVQGNGTPFPLVPTKSLLVTGPYKYTRNPMAFGAIFWLLGWAFLANSPVALLGVGIFIIILVTYIKLIEEKELEARFGEDYIIYKQQTPFIFPRLMIRR